MAGDPGRSDRSLSDLRLSDDDMWWKPRNLRTEPGRLPVGLAGESAPLSTPLEARSKWESGAESVDALRGGVPLALEMEPSGVGCESRGPLPGVGGRGVSGGESRGAGIGVPSVREKLIGVKVSGSYFPTMVMMLRMCVCGEEGMW